MLRIAALLLAFFATAPQPLTLNSAGMESHYWPDTNTQSTYQVFLYPSGGTAPYTLTLNSAPAGVSLHVIKDQTGATTYMLGGRVTATPGEGYISVTLSDAAGNSVTRDDPVQVCDFIRKDGSTENPCNPLAQ